MRVIIEIEDEDAAEEVLSEIFVVVGTPEGLFTAQVIGQITEGVVVCDSAVEVYGG